MKKKRKSKKVNLVWSKIGFAAAIIIFFIGVSLIYNFKTVGKAGEIIDKPSPQIDLIANPSADLDLSAYNEMELKIKFSGSELDEFDELILNAIRGEDELVRYLLRDKDNDFIYAYGILSTRLRSSGGLYLDADNEADIELILKNDLLTISNLKFIEPAIAEIDVYDSEFNKVDSDILYVYDETKYYFNVTSTLKPNVMVTLDGEPIELEENVSGTDFVTLSYTFNSDVAKPSELIIKTKVGDKKSESKFIVAFGGLIYELVDNKLPTVSLTKKDDKYETSYVLRKTQELQPLSLLCGNLDVAQYSANIDKILSYDKGVRQWKEKVPSDLNNELKNNIGYLFKLKKDSGLTFNVTCDEIPSANIGILSVGWNLIGVGGHKPVRTENLKIAKGDIKNIQTIYDLASITELKPGMIYWIKVE